MFQIFNITLSQTITLSVFIVLGYWLKKSNKVNEDFATGLSVALFNVFTPLLSMETFANNFTKSFLSEKSVILFASCISLIVCFCFGFILSQIFAREKGSFDKGKFDVSLYSLTIANYGYFGYPLIEGLFGEEMLFNFMIFSIPYTVFVYTFGMYILNPKKELSFKKLLNVPTLGMFVGMIIGLFEINLPTPVQNVMSAGGNCMAPAAMLLTGIVFASNEFKSMIKNVKVYIIFIVKLLLIPALLIIVLKRLDLRLDVAVCTLTIFALPSGLNSIVFPKAFGGDCKTGAQFCFISIIMSIFTLPIIFSLFNSIF